MKIWKQNILIITFVILLLTFVKITSAEADGQGDVYHYKVSTDGVTWIYEESTETKNDIDIKEISYSIDGTTLTVTMEVYGTIRTSMNYAYIFYYNTSDAFYLFQWFGTGGIATGLDFDYVDVENPLEIMEHQTIGTLTASESTLTGEIELLGESAASGVWGYATEYLVDFLSITDFSQVEWWGDYWPNTYAPWYGSETNGDGDGTDNGPTATGDGSDGDETPGFEIITLIAAIAVAIILLRKKK
jgi:hypothetical protein